MKLKIEKELINDELKKLTKIIDRHNPLESLKNIKFEVSDSGILTLTASDSTITHLSQLNTIETNGESYGALFEANTLLNAIQKINAKEIQIENSDNQLIIKSGRRKFTLNSIDVKEYPKIIDSETNKKLELTTSDFVKAINSTSKMASRKENKPTLVCVNMSGKKDDNDVVFASTDSYRLARIVMKSKENIENDFSLNIPYQFLEYVAQIIDNDNDITTLYLSNREVSMETKNGIVKTRLIDGTYPDVNRLINVQNDCVLKVDREILEDTLDCAIFKSNANESIITFELKNNELIVKNTNTQLGNFKETNNEVEYNGVDQVLSFNGEYLKQAIKTFDSKILEFHFNNAQYKPFYILGMDDEKDVTLFQLLLPVRTYE